VGENETVRVIMRFEHEQGRYMMHCHNLVHEDHDMMGQFLVGEDSPDCDPIHADAAAQKPARPLEDRHDDPDEDDDDGAGGGSRDDDDRLSSDDDVPAPVAAAAAASVPKARGSSVQATCAPKKKAPVRKKTKRKAVKTKPRAAMKAAGRGKAVGAGSTSSTPTSARCATPAKRTAPAKRKATSKRKSPVGTKGRSLRSSR
jgi:spore coat protein A